MIVPNDPNLGERGAAGILRSVADLGPGR
jgi:hypothetical protein